MTTVVIGFGERIERIRALRRDLEALALLQLTHLRCDRDEKELVAQIPIAQYLDFHLPAQRRPCHDHPEVVGTQDGMVLRA
ncbi:MAG: hypothetical protein ACUVR2_12290 [Anaerolineae bacterium]